MPKKVRIKFVSKNPIEHAHFTELPNRHPELKFVLDPLTRDYDWFVVYDDLPKSRNERFPLNSEVLACAPENTILLTYEPSTVKYYGDDYVNQFAHVLTSQEAEVLSHAGRHDAPPVGKWYYGEVADALKHVSPPEKRRAGLHLSVGQTHGPYPASQAVRFSENIDPTSPGTRRLRARCSICRKEGRLPRSLSLHHRRGESHRSAPLDGEALRQLSRLLFAFLFRLSQRGRLLSGKELHSP